MNFRNAISFNPHDTTACMENGRLVVKPGVRQRCELILLALLRRPNGALASDLLEVIRRKHKAYKRSDVTSATTRLLKSGFISRTGGLGQPIASGKEPVRFHATKGMLNLFRKATAGEKLATP